MTKAQTVDRRANGERWQLPSMTLELLTSSGSIVKARVIDSNGAGIKLLVEGKLKRGRKVTMMTSPFGQHAPCKCVCAVKWAKRQGGGHFLAGLEIVQTPKCEGCPLM